MYTIANIQFHAIVCSHNRKIAAKITTCEKRLYYGICIFIFFYKKAISESEREHSVFQKITKPIKPAFLIFS
jgi:hypothetical protein